ncbi:hypothetical protein EDC04DRAFT_2615021 [Pisolithus marmoratus]|nr:hypothetical protein EDC04DRAFT_2615021 [Pisolithus marmoratus]
MHCLCCLENFPSASSAQYFIVEILPIEHWQELGGYLAQSEDFLPSNLLQRTASTHTASMEALQIYGAESPSPSSEKSDSNGETYERLQAVKVSLVTPEHDMDTSETVQAERIPSPVENFAQEMIDWMLCNMLPSLALANQSFRTVSSDHDDDSDVETMKRMQATRVPSPPDDSDMEISEQPSPSDESDVEISKQIENEWPTLPTEVPDSSPFKEMGNVADYRQEIDFGDPERGTSMNFCLIVLHLAHSNALGALPMMAELDNMQQMSLATWHTSDNGRSWHANDTVPSTFPHNMKLDHHIMVHLSDWPEQWFLNLSIDLKELKNLLLLSVCRQSPPPLLPACYHAYVRWKDDEKAFQNELQQIPMEAFHLLDSINAFIPSWSPWHCDKYAGFACLWWLHRSSQYHADHQHLRGANVFQIAIKYFQHEWPLNELSFSN